MLTPLKYTKGLKSVVYRFEFENGHKATVVKSKPRDLFKLTSTCQIIQGRGLTNIGVEMSLDLLSKLEARK